MIIHTEKLIWILSLTMHRIKFWWIKDSHVKRKLSHFKKNVEKNTLRLWVREWFPKCYANSNVDKFKYTKTLNFCSWEGIPNEFKRWATHQERKYLQHKKPTTNKHPECIMDFSESMQSRHLQRKERVNKEKTFYKMWMTTTNWKSAQF